MSGSRLRPYLGPLVALLVVLALGAGTVYAAIPNGSGTYYACLTKSSGVVRLINYPKVKCATSERFIKWSQQGPAGPAGPAGVQGPKGDQGPAGPADWNAIGNVPAGFKDGVDDVGPGYSSALLPTQFVIGGGASALIAFAYGPILPRAVDVRLIPVPQTPGGELEVLGQAVRDNGNGTLTHTVRVANLSASSVGFKIRAMTWSDGIAPAAFRQAVRASDGGVVRLGKKSR
jgi:hypothetical protein